MCLNDQILTYNSNNHIFLIRKCDQYTKWGVGGEDERSWGRSRLPLRIHAQGELLTIDVSIEQLK